MVSLSAYALHLLIGSNLSYHIILLLILAHEAIELEKIPFIKICIGNIFSAGKYLL